MDENYSYNVELSWRGDRKGIMASDVLNDTIEVATPPEFPKGIAGIWSPEHLFVAAASSCFMTTFLAVAEKSRLEFLSFDCPASGILEKIDRQFLITKIILKPSIKITSEAEIEKAMKVLQLSHQSCLILHSIKSEIILVPEVKVEKTMNACSK